MQDENRNIGLPINMPDNEVARRKPSEIVPWDRLSIEGVDRILKSVGVKYVQNEIDREALRRDLLLALVDWNKYKLYGSDKLARQRVSGLNRIAEVATSLEDLLISEYTDIVSWGSGNLVVEMFPSPERVWRPKNLPYETSDLVNDTLEEKFYYYYPPPLRILIAGCNG